MGTLAARFAAAFLGPNGNGLTTDGQGYSPNLGDAAALGAAIDGAIPNAQDLSIIRDPQEGNAALLAALQGAVQTFTTAIQALQKRADADEGTITAQGGILSTVVTEVGQLFQAIASLSGVIYDAAIGNQALANHLGPIDTAIATVTKVIYDPTIGNQVLANEVAGLVARYFTAVTGLSWAVVDGNGGVLIGVDRNGEVVNRSAHGPRQMVTPAFYDALVDTDGVVMWGVRSTGQVYTGKAERLAPAYTRGGEGARRLFALLGGAEVVLSGAIYDDILSVDNDSDSVSFVGQRSYGGITTVEKRQVATVPQSTLLPAVTELWHVPVYGESLSVGVASGPALTTAPLDPGRGVMFRGGAVPLAGVGPTFSRDGERPLDDGALWNLVDLFETTAFPYGETIASQMAHAVLAASPASRGMLTSVHGYSSHTYAMLQRGTSGFDNLLRAVEVASVHAKMTGRTFVVPAVCFIQGVNDPNLATYVQDLVQLYNDLNATIPAITGQPQPVLLVIDQVSTATAPIDATVMGQMQAAIDNPGKIILTTPKYWGSYFAADGVHADNFTEARMGAYHGRAIAQTLAGAQPFLPLHPILAVRDLTLDTNNITVRFNVPVKPLVIDKVSVSDPGGGGVTAYDTVTGAQLTVQAIEIVDDIHLNVQLQAFPPNPVRIVFGQRQAGSAGSGPTAGPRTCLRDSSPDTLSVGGQAFNLWNWCAHSQVTTAN